MEKSFDIYTEVNERILENLKTAGSWVKMWSCYTVDPMNLHSKHQYKGINRFLLYGFEIPLFMTFNQIKENKLKLKKGAKSSIVVFWSFIEIEKGDGTKEEKPFLKYYRVFNIKNIEIPEGHKILKRIEEYQETEKNNNKVFNAPEKVIESYLNREGLEVTQGNPAYYPLADKITMPRLPDFTSSNEYYSTFFHEMVHSTGHEKRLKRNFEKRAAFGSFEYSKEELVAEIGAAYLSAKTKINNEDTDKNSAAYLSGWMGKLKDKKNKSWLTWAMPRAEKASEFILNHN